MMAVLDGALDVRLRLVAAVALVMSGCVSRLIVEEDAGGGQDDGGADATASETDDDPPLPPDCDVDDHQNDCDGDGVPDADDPRPGDPEGPGAARLDRIYLNSGDALYTLDPETLDLAQVGVFRSANAELGQVTDIAIDRFGFLYAMSGALFVCDPVTVACERVGESTANSAGFASAGVLDPEDDVLVVVEGSEVIGLHLRGGGVEREVVGSLVGYSSSGDVAELEPGILVLSSRTNDPGDVIIAFDATRPTDAVALATVSANTYGLAVWRGEIWTFDDFGSVRRVLGASPPEELVQLDIRVWGAATHPASQG